MGTIEQKFNYTFEAKEEIKQATNALGGDLTDDSELKDYAEALRGIYNNLPKVTGEGTEVTLAPTRKGRLALVPKGNSEQKTVAGNQLWKPYNYSTTSRNIDWVTSTDGTISANGNNTDSISSYSALTTVLAPFEYELPAGDYIVSGATTDVRLNVLSGSTTVAITSGSSTSATFTLTEPTSIQIRATIPPGVSASNVTIKPMINSGSTALPWEEYVGRNSLTKSRLSTEY